ncbi:Vinorine synthase-like [Melia azedarach]|uniref:Vinorine synthase-like n=1 Tax=Melia azedarach TaxID=155640 RepID=A0ACC1XFA7_MELAZ|nr:Vinorine synthase-like [Melia azedarach]
MLGGLYPLAGIIKDQTTIECNDGGAEYVEARVNCRLSDILEQPDAFVLRSFLPVEIESIEAETGSLLFVQANFFDCGGVALGVCISHKIGDAATLSTVINSWANAAVDYPGPNSAASPLFMASSIFPPLNSRIPTMNLVRDKYVTRRYVFGSLNISAIKAQATSATVRQPTRVEAVTALIWKCMINITKSTKPFAKLSLMSHSVDLRKRVEPPLPENSIGNIVGMFFAAHSTEMETDLPALVSKLRKAKWEFNKNALEIINVEKKTWLKMCGIENLAEREDIDYCTYTSWCRFPFYEADFGWGKPIWATLPNTMLKNLVVLLDSRDGGGIEALVTLSKEDMGLFEREEELFEFAAVNPSVLNGHWSP